MDRSTFEDREYPTIGAYVRLDDKRDERLSPYFCGRCRTMMREWVMVSLPDAPGRGGWCPVCAGVLWASGWRWRKAADVTSGPNDEVAAERFSERPVR